MSRSFAAPLDAVDQVDPSADGITATKRIVATDPYLAGHYPGFPIYPGVFTVETVHQAARRAVEADRGPDVRVELAAVRSVRFKAPLLPGDVLTASCQLRDDPDDPHRVRVVADCRRGDGAATAKVTLELRVRPGATDA
ncbi:polyketide synthase dehydratase domain-containing protein [Micromonospora sp. DR5-3]|uniref:3-hydroxyacyl-ACP dehydratase FabZ family protein n=1 Tax=unclassified Micromonospora TaxID=2617518 RepID=UPI0011D7E4C1|nr:MULTISPECIES: polyketide synthase dehydratase domain-containing protein [unclassified Micromonospora]MCW3816575.1 polyketide synthase dehydratase domain-containing protein [Micromonospora sp. DR5-3]TYC20233.1 3-hydroxyacyl-ACP dehydratase [Micromonospora sp. MP36]